ncbi:threonine synthase-like 1 [Babylonia areolata]|uniref:threonine synthase-like 1 n=1 Tax=Babylonia areolata TaxID=304850 RepID=UPI003FD4C11B
MMRLLTRRLSWLRAVRRTGHEVVCSSVRTLTSEGHKTWQDWRALGCKANIILMGSPGCGKTTISRILSHRLGRQCLDMDDHHLEPYWGTSVASKLREVGDKAFIEEEGKAVLNLTLPEGAVIALTGSNPLHARSMLKVTPSGVVVYLDVSEGAIIRRLNAMKVDRIVGQTSGASMAQLLAYRQHFYQRWYDLRVIVEDDETPDSIADKVSEAVDGFIHDEGFVSTRGGADDIPRSYVSFLQAVLQGLAPDGGLYVKSRHQPTFTLGQLRRLQDLDFKERSLRVLEKWIHPLDLRPQEIERMLYKSYKANVFTAPQVAPVRKLVDNHYTLELFHGPTASFKDAALQLMPHFFVKAMDTCSDVSKYVIVVATSGDTGGAVLDGFSRHAEGSRVGVVVLYPRQGISRIQHHQMTTMAGRNIKVIGVDGDFDFCQSMIKQVFSDAELATWMKEQLNCRLSAANSINWGRLLPQVLYHLSGYLDMVRMGHISLGDQVDWCVPTGNFGNILSAYYAKEMGIPVRRLICASNTNNVLTDFITKGVYVLSGKTVQRTASPSIDILRSSNLERLLFHLSAEDPSTVRTFYSTLHREGVAAAPTHVWEQIQEQFLAAFATEAECEDVMLSTFRATGYMLDPHTAVGRAAACHVGHPHVPTVISGTAHFAKFIDKILPFFRRGAAADGQNVVDLMEQAESLARLPSMHPQLAAMASKPPLHHHHLPASYPHITTAITDFAAHL